MGQALAATLITAGGQFISARNESKVLRQQAQREDEINRIDERKTRKENSALMARQRALLAARGVDITTGTPLLVQADTAKEAEFEAALVRSGSRSFRLRQEASATRTSGLLDVTTTLLSDKKISDKLFG